MPSRADIQARHLKWATARGLSPAENGYLPTYQDNLFHQLSETALASFARGSGNELVDAAGRPAKMRALHSSSALAVNVFDYFAPTPDKALHALGLPTDRARR